MRLTATVNPLRQHDGQLTVIDRRARSPDVECAGQPDSPREAAELALNQVKGVVLGGPRRRLLSGDQEHAGPKQHAKRGGGYAADIDDDFDGLVCLEHVERRMALSGVRPLIVWQVSRQILEQLTDIVRKLTRFAGGDEGELGHLPVMLAG